LHGEARRSGEEERQVIRSALCAFALSCPVTSASSPQSAPAAPARPAAAGAAQPTVDPSAFDRSTDALGDLVPKSAQVARFPTAIGSVEFRFGGTLSRVRVRAVERGVQLRTRDASGNDVLLGAFEWGGMTLGWRWSRVGASRVQEALAEADAALRSVLVRVTLVDGSERILQAPAAALRATVRQGSPARFTLAVQPGTDVRCEVDGGGAWAEGARGEGLLATFTHDAAELTVRYDADQRALEVELVDHGSVSAASLRRQIAEKEREQRTLPDGQREIVEAEIAALRSRLAAVSPARPGEPPPGLPPMRLVDSRGRLVATLELKVR
jgi:hypothetical protein